MQTYTSLKEDAVDDMRIALVVDAELFRLDALIRWLDSADMRVRAMAVQRGDDARGPVPVASRPSLDVVS